MCWRLMSCGGKGARPSAVPEQSPTSCLKCSWAERSRAARGLRGKGICLQRFNSEISSTGTFLVSPWPCGGTSHSQDGKVPRGVWKPLEKTFKITPILCYEVRNREKPEGISSNPSPHLHGICAPFFFSPNISFALSSSSTQTLHINSPGPILSWGNRLKLDGWCYWEHRSLFPSHLALLPDFYCCCFLLGTHVSLWHIRMALEIKEWDLSASKNL